MDRMRYREELLLRQHLLLKRAAVAMRIVVNGGDRIPSDAEIDFVQQTALELRHYILSSTHESDP